MNTAWDWIVQNKQWVFSGIGVTALIVLRIAVLVNTSCTSRKFSDSSIGTDDGRNLRGEFCNASRVLLKAP